MTYRPDIDGLRAIAVLAVVIFHLGVPGFEGGYVGVDAFFVISGFLITSIITRDVDAGNFHLKGFYLRRVRRLLPAMVATVAFTTLASAFVLSPYDMIGYGRSAVASLFSLSNFVFFFEAGYWDAASELKPLLHTWSLGVEEQFYLFWPALLIGMLSVRHRISFGLAVGICSVVGYVLCVWYSSIDESGAFYLLPFRVFQFSIGALVIPLSTRVTAAPKASGLLFWVGLALLTTSIFSLDEDVLFPGWVIALPTVGTACLLLAGTSGLARFPRLILENPMSIWVGRVSYSMYLVHWPLVSLYRYENGIELDMGDQVLLAVLTLVLTVALHYGVERRFYRRVDAASEARRSDARFAWVLLGFVGLVAAAPLNAWQGDGWAWRYADVTLTAEQISDGKKDRFLHLRKACFVNYSIEHKACNWDAKTQILVLGNSHEPDGLNFLMGAIGDEQSVNIVVFGTVNKCRNLQHDEGLFTSTDKDCQTRLNALYAQDFVDRLDLILYASNKPHAANKGTMLEMLSALKTRNPNTRIAVLGGYINTKLECARYINEYKTARSCTVPEHVSYFEEFPDRAKFYPFFEALTDLYIDRVALLCKNRVLQTCRVQTEDGIPAFYDQHHHSLEFAEMSGRLFEAQHPGSLLGLADD